MGHGQAELDRQATSVAVSSSEPSTEERRVFGRNGETEAAPASPRRIGHEEAVEDAIETIRGDARSPIGDLDRDLIGAGAKPNDHDGPWRVLPGVVEEIAEDPLQPAGIRLDDDPVL